jgi:hypothetical protein
VRIAGALIKFFPLAFYIVDRAISDLQPELPSFRGDGCNDLECKIDLLIDLTGDRAGRSPHFCNCSCMSEWIPIER